MSTITPDVTRDEARAALLERLDPTGTVRQYAHLGPDALDTHPTVYVIQRHVSRSGMLRRLSLFVIVDGDLRDVTYWAAAALGRKLTTDRFGDWTLTVTGAGMDMHFHTVYQLSRALFTDVTDGNAGYVLQHRSV